MAEIKQAGYFVIFPTKLDKSLIEEALQKVVDQIRVDSGIALILEMTKTEMQQAIDGFTENTK